MLAFFRLIVSLMILFFVGPRSLEILLDLQGLKPYLHWLHFLLLPSGN